METFTVLSVDEFSGIEMVMLRCDGARNLMMESEQYFEGKQAIAQATGVTPDEVDMVGMTIMLNQNGEPTLPPAQSS